MLKNPNDPIGLAALLGENMSHTEIAALVTDAGVVQVVDDEQNRINNTDNNAESTDNTEVVAQNKSEDYGLGRNKEIKALEETIRTAQNSLDNPTGPMRTAAVTKLENTIKDARAKLAELRAKK